MLEDCENSRHNQETNSGVMWGIDLRAIIDGPYRVGTGLSPR